MQLKNYKPILVAIIMMAGVAKTAYSQVLSAEAINEIKSELSVMFDKNIEAGEKFEYDKLEEGINDTFKSGFIDNGLYYKSFDDMMARYKEQIKGITSQKMNVETKKITVLSKNNALLTAHGTYTAGVYDGRVLNGKFAWTFVYSKIDGKWVAIHSHMSNPR